LRVLYIKRYPIRKGRDVSIGARQSIPDSR
jgi:hypothetical protein